MTKIEKHKPKCPVETYLKMFYIKVQKNKELEA